MDCMTGNQVKLFRQFLSFAVVGVFGTAAHFAVLIFSVQTLSMHPLSGSMAGFVAGAGINYFLNYHVTFKSVNRHTESFPKFFTIATIGLGLNILIMYVMGQWFYYLICQVIATGIVLIWNFSSNRLWTFREDSLANQ
jgi:putative flippase GtrA